LTDALRIRASSRSSSAGSIFFPLGFISRFFITVMFY
jgi:hypothetical protein